MIATPRVVTVADLAVEAGPPRSDTLHVSKVIRALMEHLEPERFGQDGEFSEADRVRIETGFTVERALETAWASRRIEVVRPGEIERDGLTGSPDGISYDDDGPIVEEIKCTWKSSADCPNGKKFWYWIVQIKAYCYMVGTLRARLHVVFVNGNYRDSRDPQYLSWDLQFHRGEVDENWMMLTNQARALRGH